MTVTRRGLLWEILNSWWIILSFCGLSFISFFYIGNKSRTTKWKVTGILYFLVYVVALTCIATLPFGTLSNIAVVVWLASLLIGLIQSFMVRKEYLIRRDYILTNGIEDKDLDKIREDVRRHYKGKDYIKGSGNDTHLDSTYHSNMEYRDYDTISNNPSDSLFENEINKIKIAALLMLDLDNLKYINDNYGHEIGDNYISKAAETFVNSTPENTIISRISGDEFFVFFYGYDDENVIKQLINKLKEAISKAFIPLADNSNFHVNASGGIAWYPRDSESFEKLQHYADYADYAMYKIKRTSKGNLTEFNLNDYIADSFLSESKEELNTIIEDRAIQFYFQPIISSKDGTIYAYESLMRSFMPSLKNPLDILKIAKEEGRLAEIEELTWSSSLETFANHLRNERINKDCKIFINSISNQILSNKKIDELEKEYSKYLKNVVLEVTEVEYIDENYHQQKAELMKKWQAELALDDYGSGYNSDRILLLISPKFIKIDMDIIRNIDSDPDKCKIVENIVNYAHERDMKLIAEGIETIDELKQVIKLKVDYLQGFLLAKPQYLPPRIQEDVIKLIQLLNEK